MNKKPILYLQTDKKWSNVDYSAKGEKTDIGESGCGPTSAAMLIATFVDSKVTPVEACKWSLENGHKAVKQGTYYSFFKPYFAKYKLDCKQLNTSNVYGKSKATVHEEAYKLLMSGWYLIAVMGPGNWTRGGHFVLPYWVDKKKNIIYINDPASTKKERTEGDYELFKSQVKYYWAIDVRKFNKGAEDVSTYSKKIISIPLNNIEKMEIYINKKHNKKSLDTIMKETGADYGINGGLYNPDWTACPLLKSDGSMISEDPYTMWGYGWNDGSDITMSNNHKDFANYIGCTDMMNPWTGGTGKMIYGSGQGGKRGRTAIGIRGDELVLYCSKDGGKESRTPEALRQEMIEFGCDTAVMLDSGGSSQISIKNGGGIYSTRKVHNYILIYKKGNTSANKSDKKNDHIKKVQKWLNEKYDAKLIVDGSWGAASKKALVKAIQKEIGVTVDGSFGPKTRSACPVLKKGAKGDMVWLLQAALCVNGQITAMDGSFGSATLAAVRAYQKNNNLSIDGSVGPITWTSLVG